MNSCIRYDTVFPYSHFMIGLYLLATCGSCLISSIKFIRWFGLVVFIAAVVAGWFYLSLFSSVWCFFAAILSGLVILSIAVEQREHVKRGARPMSS